MEKEKQDYLIKMNSVHYYKNNGDHVYVYNNTHEFDSSKRQANIIIPMKDKEAPPLKIFITKLPIDLTEQAVKDDIINNPYFMQQLKCRNILICPDEEAEAKLSTTEAINEITNYKKNAAALANDAAFNRNNVELKDEANYLTTDVSDSANEVENRVNLTVLDTLSRDEISDNEKISIFNSIDELTSEDLKYIIDNAKSEVVRDFALNKTSTKA